MNYSNPFIISVKDISTLTTISPSDSILIKIDWVNDSLYLMSTNSLWCDIKTLSFPAFISSWNNFDSLNYLSITPAYKYTIDKQISIDTSGDTSSYYNIDSYNTFSNLPQFLNNNFALLIDIIRNKNGQIFMRNRSFIYNFINASNTFYVNYLRFNGDSLAYFDTLSFETYLFTDTANIRSKHTLFISE